VNLEKEKERAALGRICRKGRFEAWNESEWVMEYQVIVSMTVGR